jgi:REP element-mobilizing transposase RayT
MPLDRAKGHAALRRGRVSTPGATYFLTVCTDHRVVGLIDPRIAGRVLSEMQAAQKDEVWLVRCAVVMPDHLHLLVDLGAKLALGKAISRLKAKTSADLRGVGLYWERGFFDHRLRAADDVLDVFLYIFLNPYRAGLCARTESWPWFHCHSDDWVWFRDRLDEERPPPEWLGVYELACKR